VGGLGVGNRTVDWVIGAAFERRVLIDVKWRFADIFGQMGGVVADGRVAPQHDVRLLFRSVQGKFLPKDPAEELQARGSSLTFSRKKLNCKQPLIH